MTHRLGGRDLGRPALSDTVLASGKTSRTGAGGYSPDVNRLEAAFSEFKADLKCRAARTVT